MRINYTQNKDLAIVVSSYDGYSDLWHDFFFLLEKYWGDRTYNTYLINNTKKPIFKNVDVINSGSDAEWSTRIRDALKKIKEPYICLLLEDFYISEKINDKDIQDIVSLMKKENIKYYKLNTFSRIKELKYKGLKHISIIPQDYEYGISLQAAIWDKELLTRLIGDSDYNAWEFESKRNHEARNHVNITSGVLLFDNRNVLNICHSVVQGKYLPSAIKKFKKKGYLLNTTDRKIMNSYEYYIYRLKTKGKDLIPKSMKTTVKSFLRKFGVKFIS